MRVALHNLTNEIMMARLMCETFTNIRGDGSGVPGRDPHGWVFLLETTVCRIDTAAQELERFVLQNAIPVLADMEGVTKGVPRAVSRA
jgi:hypothetical protein